MKCLNPDCGSINADEVNLSLNVSFCIPGEAVEYEGSTEYGEDSQPIGTSCPDCLGIVFIEGIGARIRQYLGFLPGMN